MAEENLKDFTINWIVTGFLLFSLLFFAIFFMSENNEIGFGDNTDNIFSEIKNNLSSNIIELPDDADNVLNITSSTNPEVSDLGSRDSVSSSYSAKRTAGDYFKSSKKMLAWVFSGESGEMILAVFTGIFGFLAFYYIAKFIRNGI